MGVDAKWGRSPICPEMSRFVPVCRLLSRFVPVPGPKKDKRGQMGTKRDISAQIGKRPHLASTPILALLKLILGTTLAMQNRSDHGGCEHARNHSAADIARFFASPAAKISIARFWGKLSRKTRSDHSRSRRNRAISWRPLDTKLSKVSWVGGGGVCQRVDSAQFRGDHWTLSLVRCRGWGGVREWIQEGLPRWRARGAGGEQQLR